MKRILAVLLATAMLFSITGCSNGSDTSSAGTAPPASTEVKNSTEDKPRDVTLNMVLTYYGRIQEEIDWLCEKFAEKEKTEKNINVTFNIEYPADDTLLKTRLSSGEAPDIFNMHAKLDAPLYNKGGYLPDLTNEPFAGKLLDSIRPAVTIDDKIVAVPLESSTWSYLYNKKLFAANNITPPKTLSEMKTVTETLKAAGIVPFELAYKEAYVAGWGCQVPMCAIAAKKVPDFYEKMDKGEGSFQSMVDAGLLDVFDLINLNGGKRPLEIGVDDGVAKFAMGEAAMMVTGPWYADSILKVDPEFELGVAPLPIDDNPDNTVVMLAVSTVLTCSPDSPNLDVAKDFLNFVLDDSVSSEFFNKVKFNQVATNQTIDSSPWAEEGLAYMASGNFYDEYPIPSAINDELGRLAQLYFDKQIDRAGFVTGMDQIWAKTMAVK